MGSSAQRRAADGGLVSPAGFVTEKLPQPLQARVDKKAHVADAESGRGGYLAITEFVLKFEPQAFRLIVREPAEKAENVRVFLAVGRGIVRRRLARGNVVHRR